MIFTYLRIYLEPPLCFDRRRKKIIIIKPTNGTLTNWEDRKEREKWIASNDRRLFPERSERNVAYHLIFHQEFSVFGVNGEHP